MLSDEGTKKRNKPIEDRNTFSFVVFSTLAVILLFVLSILFSILTFIPVDDLIPKNFVELVIGLLIIDIFLPIFVAFLFEQLPYKPIDYSREAIKRSILHKLYFIITSPVFIFGFIISYFLSKGVDQDYFFSSNIITVLGTLFFSFLCLIVWSNFTLKLWEIKNGVNSSQTLRLRRNRSKNNLSEMNALLKGNDATIQTTHYHDSSNNVLTENATPLMENHGTVQKYQKRDSSYIDLTEMDALLQEYEDYEERETSSENIFKGELFTLTRNFYYTRLVQQSFWKKNTVSKKFFIIFTIIFCIIFEWITLVLNPISITINTIPALILITIIYYLLICVFFALILLSLGIINYNYEKKTFANLILACQTDEEKKSLGESLANFVVKANSRTTRLDKIEMLSYEFFKAKFLLTNNHLKESLELFESLSRKINKKFHLLFEVYFQMGKIYVQLDNKEKALSFLDLASKGFEKFKYVEPLREIEELRKFDYDHFQSSENKFNLETASTLPIPIGQINLKQTSSNEWFLFCSLVPSTLFLIMTILTELFSPNTYSILIDLLICYGIFFWLVLYDSTFIKNGYQIGLFEKIRIPLNKKNRISDDLPPLSFVIMLTLGAGVVVLDFPEYNFLFILIMIVINVYFVHAIWHFDEINDFLLKKGKFI